MCDDYLEKVQRQVSQLKPMWFESLHRSPDVPKIFRPWTSNLSPSALYNCSLPCRKAMGIPTPEVKWMSIKRWVTTTPAGVILPPGVHFSIKRKEEFRPDPAPHFQKIEYGIFMFPYGNVWSQVSPGIPITESWVWSYLDGVLIFERLMRKDAAFPIKGFFEASYNYMSKNPDQIGIHLKRQKKTA